MFPAFFAFSEAIELCNCASAASPAGVRGWVLVVEAEVNLGVALVGVAAGFFVVRDLAPSIARNCGQDFCSTLITPFLGFESGRDIS